MTSKQTIITATKILARTLLITTILISFSTLSISKYIFYFDLFSHFQLQYLISILLIGVFLFLIKDRKYAVSAFIYSFILFSFVIFPIQVFPNRSHNDNNPEIFFMNINIFNKDIEPIINEIRNANPNAIAIVELTPGFHNAITETADYSPVFDNYGGTNECNIYSKTEPLSSEYTRETTYPICIAEFKDYTLIVVHPYPPLSPEMLQLQKNNFAEIENILQEVSEQGENFVLVGDFNSTYYSANFRESFYEYFHQNTYSWNVYSINTLPIDHALSNFDIEINKTEKLSSDHTGLLISF